MGRMNGNQHKEKANKLRQFYWPWIALLIIVLLAIIIRIRLLDVPLERDEGEYAYAGQLILQGIAPYENVYSMKMPGIYAAYALILAVFGQTHSGIHLGLSIVNIATILLLFLLAKRLFNPLTAVVAAAAFALLSLSQSVLGMSANAEHFVILPALGGILLLLRAIDHQKWFSLLAGAILLAVAYLMKQHGAAFIIFAGMYLFFHELRRRPFMWVTFVARCILFISGVMLPFAVTCLVFHWAGAFENFWFWTFDYAHQYVSALPLYDGLETLKVQIFKIVNTSILLWILAGVGFISPLYDKKSRQNGLFVTGFSLFSFLAICPGFYFRPHYFILLLPAVSLLAGVGVASVKNLLGSHPLLKTVPVLLTIAVLAQSVYKQRYFFFVVDPITASRMTYGLNPFPESIEIAKFIKENSAPSDFIAVIGSEPQIYFYSNRRSATGYIYTYPLMRGHPYAVKMQQEMIREIESKRPTFLIFVHITTSWLKKPSSEDLIFTWFQKYQQKYYKCVGVVDIISKRQTIYRWNEQAIEYSPRSKFWLSLFHRNN